MLIHYIGFFKIPLGMRFEKLKRFIGKGLMKLGRKLGKKPNVFIVCWSPSKHSAHALSGEDTLETNPIESLGTTFKKSDIEVEGSIDRFIEKQFLGPLSMEDAFAALNASSARMMTFWDEDPIDFMVHFAVLSSEMKVFLNKRHELMKAL